jgi:hypothetical protein
MRQAEQGTLFQNHVSISDRNFAQINNYRLHESSEECLTYDINKKRKGNFSSYFIVPGLPFAVEN